MSAAWVNSGTQSTGTSGAASSALPGSRSNGNTLIAHVHVTGGAVSFSISSGGWTMIDQLNQGSGNDACLAWRVVDGTEAAPVFTNDLTTWSCEVHQFSSLTSSPIGNKTKASGTTSTLAVGAVTTSQPNSLIAAFLSASQNGVIPTPTSYTRRDHNEVASFSDILADETVASSGVSSDAVSVSITAVPWAGFLVELLFNDPIKQATAVLAGSATLSASAQALRTATAILAGVGALAADTVSNTSSANLSGAGTLSADAHTNAIKVALSGAGNISVDARLKTQSGAAVLLTGL